MKISIITATYNSSSTLRYTIESILRQDYRDIEYIVIDGGSKDDTLSIIKEFEPRFEGKMRWISEPDNGLYYAMNKGIALATGDYVGILNSDDFYTSSDILSSIAKAIEKYKVDAVYGDIHYVNSNDLQTPVRYYSSKSFKRWKMRYGFMPAHPSFYCKRKCYTDFGNFDTTFKIGADFEHLLRLIFVNNISTKYIHKDFVTMRTGGISTSGLSSHKLIYRDHMRAYSKNKVYSNFCFEACRYIYKVLDLALFKAQSFNLWK